jgi:hypothetical protein
MPALDCLLPRSSRISDLQKLLAQADISMRAGNFLGIWALIEVATTHPGLCPQHAHRSKDVLRNLKRRLLNKKGPIHENWAVEKE